MLESLNTLGTGGTGGKFDQSTSLLSAGLTAIERERERLVGTWMLRLDLRLDDADRTDSTGLLAIEGVGE